MTRPAGGAAAGSAVGGPTSVADRLHDGPLQLLGSALLKAELCEQLLRRGRTDELPARLGELRALLHQTAFDLRLLMADLRGSTPA